MEPPIAVGWNGEVTPSPTAHSGISDAGSGDQEGFKGTADDIGLGGLLVLQPARRYVRTARTRR